jgi:conjugative relaxase-like TrwC/TraI family protein
MQNAAAVDNGGAMLTIGKLGKGQERYYTEKVAEGAEDYYCGEGEAPGEWIGDAARDLGLGGEVGADQLTAMLTGHDPRSGEPLLGTVGVPSSGPVPGFDLTFSAPKSVSLLWALGGAEVASQVKAAHAEALHAALSYMQREACWTRRGAGGREFVPGNGYLGAAYRHRSSRNGDPQLHSHVLIANATRGPDGRWTRLYHPAIYEHAKSAGYIYEAHLRHELSRRLGVEWQQVRNGIAEARGFSDEHLRAFSTRRAEILEAAGPGASARSLQVATLATREAKEEVARGDLLERWRERAAEIGLDREMIERTFDPEATFNLDAAVTRTVSTRQVDRAVTAGASHFDRRDAIQAVADSLPNGALGTEVERLADAFLASEEVIQVGESRQRPTYTTRRIWDLEREALAAVERMKSDGPTPAGELAAARVIAARPTLKADQREMVRRLLAGPEGVCVVIGEAGTGKTFALLAAAEGWAQAGTELRAAAPTWKAADVIRSDGLPATTVAGLLAELDRAERGDGLAYGSVLLVDEAGMVGSAELARLIDHAERAKAKLVLVGDPEQLGEIEAGGLFRAVADRGEPIVLDEVIRHEHELDREAAKHIRAGEGREALGLYESGERITVAPDSEARRQVMVADWHEAFEAGEDAVMIAKRNIDVGRLNAMAREARIEAGKLGAAEIEVGEARFAAGDLVITRVNDRTAAIHNRERWRIAEVDAEQGSATLEGVDRSRTVEVAPDYLARTSPYSDAPALQHAYAVTTYSAQGATFDHAYVMADPSMDKQELYVATSRSRGETRLYATPEVQAAREEIAPESPHLREGIPHIAEASERDRAQLAAHEVALRSEFAGLPDEQLRARREELAQAALAEQRVANPRGRMEKRIEEGREARAKLEAEHRMELVLNPEGSEALSRIETNERLVADQLSRIEADLAELPTVGDSARRELAVAERVLAERREMAILAACLDPPPYIASELGARPADPIKAKAWEKGVARIEGYRQEHGINDPSRPFGREAERGAERAERRAELRRLRETQRVLGLGQHAARERDLGLGLGIGR